MTSRQGKTKSWQCNVHDRGKPKAIANKCECAYHFSNLYFALYSV